MNLPVNLSDVEAEAIMSLSGCSFSPKMVCTYLGYEINDFMKIFNDTSSDLRQAYDAGKMRNQFNVLNKQRELAESGNITSAQIFMKETEKIEIENIRNKCLFGDEY